MLTAVRTALTDSKEAPRDVTEVGIVMVVRPTPWNNSSARLTIEVGICIEVN